MENVVFLLMLGKERKLPCILKHLFKRNTIFLRSLAPSLWLGQITPGCLKESFTVETCFLCSENLYKTTNNFAYPGLNSFNIAWRATVKK